MSRTRPGTAQAPPPTRVGIRVDANATIGVGHAVRCLALAQELRSRNISVHTFGALEVPWVEAAYGRTGSTIRSAAEIATAPLSHAVVDGYAIPPEIGGSLRARGVRTLAMVDGRFGATQDADIYVDQNFGSEDFVHPVPAGTRLLAGIEYALFRDNLLAARGHRPKTDPPRLLAVFGGTDPLQGCPDLVELALATTAPVHVLAVAATDEIAHVLKRLQPNDRQSIEILRDPADLPALAAGCDAAISAAGSTIWEMLCLGVPTASVCVIDNQEQGYRATVDAGLTVAGGRLSALRGPNCAGEQALVLDQLTQLLRSARLRQQLSDAGRALVDGQGRVRVVDALLDASSGVQQPLSR